MNLESEHVDQVQGRCVIQQPLKYRVLCALDVHLHDDPIGWSERHFQPRHKVDNAHHKVVTRLVLENIVGSVELVGISVPALVLVGEDDKPYRRAGEVMSAKLQNARHVVVPDAGHIVNIEQPDVFEREVLAFLADLEGA